MKARIYSGYLSISLFFMSLLIMGVTDSYASVYFSITPDIQTLHIMPGTTVSDIQFTVRNTSGVTLHQTAFVKDKPVPGTHGFSALLPIGALDTCQGDLSPNQTCRFALQVKAPYGSAKGTIAPKVCSEGVLCDSGNLVAVTDSVAPKKAVYVVTTPLPQTVPVNKPYPIVVNVTNPNANYSLTGLNLTYDKTYITITQNDCHNVLLPGASCALSGNFQSPTPGAYSLFMRLGYNEDDGSPIDVSAKGVVSNIAVVGQTVLPLPSDVVPGYQYPVIFQYTNYGNKDVTDAEVKTTQRPDFTHIAGTCPGLNGAAKGTLAAGASCLVEGTLTPQAAGSDITLSSTLTYAEQIQPSVLYTTAESSNVAVNAQAAIKLPDNMTAGHPYSFLFTFTNTSDKLSVSNLNFIKTLQHAILTSDTCAGVTSLAKGASCDIGGNYTPTIEGPAVLSVSLQYGIHNHLITAKTNGTVTKVAVTGEVLTPLPANIASNSSHTVTFQFSNTGSAPATGLTWVTVLPDFVIAPNADTCSGKATLAADESCEITGSYTATSAGTKALSVKLSYNESAQDINLLANTNVTNVVVTGALTTDIPHQTQVRTAYPFQFTFTNTSSAHSANITHVKHLPYTENVVDTCQSTLPAGDFCAVRGDYFPIYTGPQILSTSLVYDKGLPVTVSTKAFPVGKLYLFVSQLNDKNILRCQISSTNTLVDCTVVGTGFQGPSRFAFSRSASHVYIPNWTPGNDVTTCTVSPSGVFSNCSTKGGFSSPRDIVVAPSGERLYVANAGNNTISNCVLNADETIGSCSTLSPVGGSVSTGVAINPDGKTIYIAHHFGSIATCSIDPSTGSLSNCSNKSGFSGVHGITINPAGTFLYTANAGSGTISRCQINPNGSLGSCQTALTLSTPQKVTFTPSGQHAFVSADSNRVYSCTVNSDGDITNCQQDTTFSRSRGVLSITLPG